MVADIWVYVFFNDMVVDISIYPFTDMVDIWIYFFDVVIDIWDFLFFGIVVINIWKFSFLATWWLIFGICPF